MPDSVTVVINAAGLGTRLGLYRPKSIVEVQGKPLLGWQLDLLDGIDVVVVAGYQAESIVGYLRERRPDVPVVLNHEYRSTGTAASLALGARVAGDWVVSLDGDLLVAPESLRTFVEADDRLVGLTPTVSETPVGATIDERTREVTEMSFAIDSGLEWSGLVRLRREEVLQLGRGHVFESLERHLPIPSVLVDCVEIDEPEDLARAASWLEDHTENGEWKRMYQRG
jgi:choline kinase